MKKLLLLLGAVASVNAFATTYYYHINLNGDGAKTYSIGLNDIVDGEYDSHENLDHNGTSYYVVHPTHFDLNNNADQFDIELKGFGAGKTWLEFHNPNGATVRITKPGGSHSYITYGSEQCDFRDEGYTCNTSHLSTTDEKDYTTELGTHNTHIGSVKWGAYVPANAPTGSYQETCTGVTFDGKTLKATCPNAYGQDYHPSLAYSTTCANDSTVSNVNGVLKCDVLAPPAPSPIVDPSIQPSGSYSELCSNVTWAPDINNANKYIITANHCNGVSFSTQLDYTDRCQPGSDVNAYNGYLKCAYPLSAGSKSSASVTNTPKPVPAKQLSAQATFPW